MATHAGSRILIDAPKNAWGLQTFITKGVDILPGVPVTMTGETAPEVVTVGTANDVTLGVVLCNPGHDIDLAYAAGVEVTVAMAGSGAAVWTYAKANVADLFAGASLHTDAGTGIYSIIGENMLFEWVGRVIEFSATDASDDRPVKVVLC